MKRSGAVTVGILCLAVAVVHAADGDQGLNADPAQALINRAHSQKENIKLAGWIPAKDPDAGKPKQAVAWVSIAGGKYALGTTDFDDSKPIPNRPITIPTFAMSKTLVTVEQYKECVIKGVCTKPDTGTYCNYDKAGREDHPVNCVSWFQAKEYAAFEEGKPGSAGARLPTESEWEYAATSGGKNQKYPWGNEDATCDKAVMYGKDAKSGKEGYGCGNDSTMPVCSKPKSALSLCDAVGNVWQWVQDTYQNSYAQTPTDGKAYEGTGSARVVRGGSFSYGDAGGLRADYRFRAAPGYRYGGFGFRLARSSR